eukprot:scaffold771_cov147-Skeletonema_menzelii.AAC.14
MGRGKRLGKWRNGHSASTAAVQPKLHENMDEVDLHGENYGEELNRPKIKSAKFVPLTLVVNNKGADPPDDSDSDHEFSDDDAENYRRPREDFSDVETNNIKHAKHNREYDEDIIGQRHSNDHSFTQFHIPPEQRNHQQQFQNNSEDSDDESDSDYGSSDDEENATFFPSSDNFNYATDKPESMHKEGEQFGVDYLKSRAERKARERLQRFEIESWQYQRRSDWKWCCWEDDPDDFDDIDFLDYQETRKKRVLVANMAVFLLSFILGTAIMEHQMHFLSGKSKSSSKHNSGSSLHQYGNASSRWGHRFDDDGMDGDDTIFGANVSAPKYHSHNHNNHGELTEEEIKEDIEQWEDYEMDVANVLANSGTEWDIHSKTGVIDDGDDSDDADKANTDHWVQYFDQSAQRYYYFHKETNTTTWTKPEIVNGVVLLGLTRSGSGYVIEEFKDDDNEEEEASDGDDDTFDETAVDETEEIEDEEMTSTSSVEIPSNFNPQEVLDQYKDTMWRWNHPYRIPERTEVWGGIDTPVFWHIPNSGVTTVEEIFEHCYHMVIAGTTGSNNDGKIVLKRNITEHLSVYTLEDGAHYLNINLRTPAGINLARTAGLGKSGVADVILTRYIFNAADLFRDTGHTGRCFTFVRHPVERIVSKFHTMRRNKAPEVKGMSLDEYAKSEIAESNWMTRMLVNATEGPLTPSHYQVAKEIFGRKCLVGLMDHFEESMGRFSKFFRFETTHSINTKNKEETANFVEERKQCAHKLATKGVNRHQYAKMAHDSVAWKELERKNTHDIELYNYAKAMYYQQAVVYEDLP